VYIEKKEKAKRTRIHTGTTERKISSDHYCKNLGARKNKKATTELRVGAVRSPPGGQTAPVAQSAVGQTAAYACIVSAGRQANPSQRFRGVMKQPDP
jgi:hypothetical protein